jgi:hypothetical protein
VARVEVVGGRRGGQALPGVDLIHLLSSHKYSEKIYPKITDKYLLTYVTILDAILGLKVLKAKYLITLVKSFFFTDERDFRPLCI